MIVLDCSDWSNGIRYRIFHARRDTEFYASLTIEHNAVTETLANRLQARYESHPTRADGAPRAIPTSTSAALACTVASTPVLPRARGLHSSTVELNLSRF